MTTRLHLDRRTLLKAAAMASASTLAGRHSFAAGAARVSLPPRRAGELDIHHIDTGRGNCTLIVGPDGTTLMIDAGAAVGAEETSSKARPDATRRPGEWQARYAKRCTAATSLDYLLVTHIHPDHVGDVSNAFPQSPGGAFRYTGISDVDRLLPIGTVIDRAYPDYGDTPPPPAPFTQNYLAFLKERLASGRAVERAQVGSDRQIKLKSNQYPHFSVRLLTANGTAWTGHEAKRYLPKALPAGESLNENIFSISLRLQYGRFSYFTGGDLPNDTFDGQKPWMDLETPAVHAAGRVEVAAADHHGYFDACGPEFVRDLDAQAYIIQAWDVGHPGSAQIQRMLGAWSGKGTRDVFATDNLPVNSVTNRRFVPQLKSRRGHVVVRVAADTNSYRIFVVDSDNEDGIVNASFGPYVCRHEGA